MKKLVLVMLAMVVVNSLVFAEGEPAAGKFGVQTRLIFTSTSLPSASGFGAKFMINDSIALRAALGILNYKSSGSSITLFDLGAGFEYHFAPKGGVSPYVSAELSYSAASFSGGGTSPSDFGLCAAIGGEYFFSSNFSWAGEARLGYDSYKDGAGVTTTYIGTFGFATFLTFYIN